MNSVIVILLLLLLLLILLTPLIILFWFIFRNSSNITSKTDKTGLCVSNLDAYNNPTTERSNEDCKNNLTEESCPHTIKYNLTNCNWIPNGQCKPLSSSSKGSKNLCESKTKNTCALLNKSCTWIPSGSGNSDYGCFGASLFASGDSKETTLIKPSKEVKEKCENITNPSKCLTAQFELKAPGTSKISKRKMMRCNWGLRKG